MSFREENGYIVLSGNVNALMNVARELFSRSTKGSRSGYFSDPFSTECSRIWKIPVWSDGTVRKAIPKVLLTSSRSSQMTSAPFFQ